MSSPSASQSILIIEDDAFLSRALADKFKHEGFTVEVANNGEQGLEKLRTGTFSLVLLDLMMPVKNGFEVLADIQADATLAKIPVIVLSNLGQESDIEKAKKLGACDFLVKSNVPLKEVVSRARVCMV